VTITQDSTAQSFPPEPVSVRNARRFLRSFLREQARDDLVDAAEMALSEIVTNAVLHAHTDFEVSAALLDDGSLRVEVTDSSPQLPAQRRYGEQATTGRGMQLVAAVTADCGVVGNGARGKTVWFLVRGDRDAEVLGGMWDVAPVAPVPTDGEGRVLLLGLPPTLWLAARQHHDAVLRELVLFAQEHPDRAPSPARFAQADRARGIVSAAVVAAVERRAGDAPGTPTGHPVFLSGAEPPLDLAVQVPADAAATYAALQDVLDAAERLAAAGVLLARPGLPEIVAVRDWVCEQILAQHAGALPSAWRGWTEDAPAGEHGAPVAVHWDLDAITGAERGFVAADDTNRILAVSRPLAEALGWTVEDLVGRRIVALVPPELREAHIAGFSRHVTTGETRVLGVRVQLPVLHADGRRLVCDVLIERRSSLTGRHLYVASIEPVA
jgi:PAS domain S-box-containing protein